MKRIALILAALIFSGSAFAADMAMKMPVNAPPPVAPVYNWTGFYAGLNAGGGWGASDPTTRTVFSPIGYFAASSVAAINPVGAQTAHSGGFTGGAEVGYNQQINSLVWGLEADFNYLGLKDSASGSAIYPCCAPTGFTINSSVSTDWLLTVRPRIGIANGSWLYYATGGLAVSNLRGKFNFGDNFAAAAESAAFSTTKAGWTAGGGVEFGLSGNWTAKAEYLYVDLGSASATSSNLNTAIGAFPASVFTHSTDLKANIVRAGVNYRL
jgi:outer membrane immunogenic protein